MRGQLDGEPEVLRRLGGPALEVPLGGQPVARRVQLDRREPLRVAAQELRRLRVGGVETGLPARVGEPGSSDIRPCYPRRRGGHARSVAGREHLRAGPRLRAAGRRDGRRPLRRQLGTGQLRPSGDRARRRRRRADQVPDARAARHAVRAQLVPVPRSLPDLRRARVVPASHRVVQRVLDALREGDRRLLRARARGRADAGRQAGVVLVRAGRRGARRDDARGAAGRVRGGVRDVRAACRAGRRARARAGGASRRRLHRVLLDGERARPDELRLAARLRERAARDPPLRRGGRAASSRTTCRSRTRRSSRTTARRLRSSERRAR